MRVTDHVTDSCKMENAEAVLEYGCTYEIPAFTHVSYNNWLFGHCPLYCFYLYRFWDLTLSQSSCKILLSLFQSMELVPVSNHQNRHKTKYIYQTQHGQSVIVKTNISKHHIHEYLHPQEVTAKVRENHSQKMIKKLCFVHILVFNNCIYISPS